MVNGVKATVQEFEHDLSRWLVRAKGITKSFGEGHTKIPVLKGVDLDVARGEVLLLVGPSGSGKTTLLSVIAGILEADEGELMILGENIKAFSQSAKTLFRRDHLGFVFQQYHLLPTLTASENAAVPLLIRGMPKRDAMAHAEEVLRSVGMGERLASLPNRLSGGEQQRVAIARALAGDPQLLLCDEPTASLDAETGHRVVEQLRAIGKRPDRAVIIVTHDSRIFEFGDRIVHMDDGLVHQIQDGSEQVSG
ncbi:MAG: ABC transporter ATP-binding protein [Nitrospira sp.]|nr:ABC transporter ATP-binding protein [Nitrospira sp.]MCA9476806.1 ABC transporter ATP-binding protein [Nitrospira sp.]MCA9480656.1 ABC transporter ATP-binding protein [Nitrospira sp.]MDR4488188.1 ABC transporter ATP-binding protein [Nitrospirales bacterium]HQU28249.1 ABC transporter ATP-binding protein [Nitrospirales bacterium]